jgi:hypothetical protein
MALTSAFSRTSAPALARPRVASRVAVARPALPQVFMATYVRLCKASALQFSHEVVVVFAAIDSRACPGH